MKVEVKIPAVGESITEATISTWNKKTGESVKRNDVLLLVETDKASVELVAENDGVLEIRAEAGAVLPIGSVVGYIDTIAQASTSVRSEKLGHEPRQPEVSPTLPVINAGPQGAVHLSPAVNRIVHENALDPAKITGTGKDGRITKADALNVKSTPPAVKPPPTAVVLPAIAPGLSRQGQTQRMPMNNIRRRIAERLVEAQHTAAILTTFNEVDMSKILELRNKYKDSFKEKYNASLGFMGFFTKAVVEALKAWPAVNSSIDGTDLVYKQFYNIGVAVGTDRGLIVPVIKDADLLSIAGVELAIKNFATKARDGKITIDDLSGGTFTISNGGVYGSLMSTPILNYPQAGILGMHKIEDRPMAINGKVEVRPMMYLALSYDHRIIDGKEAVSFLVKIKECVEAPERLLLEI